ncbi:hypothetical protein [Streptomyces sp. SUK 48]|uniref:hypothetical protein n=1 Tax=Streptomyces sp. SUK 48 TaxID=2582831 RepID=UPI001890BC6A|nr:hypothetical protein [Streptomyces sp. SUK 48]
MAVLAHQEAQSSDSRHRHEARDPTEESAAVVKTADALDEHSLLNPEPARVFLVWTHRRPRGGKRLHASVATLYYCVATWAEECELLTHAADSGVGEQGADAGEIHEQLNLKRCADGGARTVPGSRPWRVSCGSASRAANFRRRPRRCRHPPGVAW